MAVDKSAYSLGANRLSIIATASSKEEALKLNRWDSIKDFFRGGTKRETIEKLFTELHSSGSGEPILSGVEAPTKNLKIFNEIRSHARPEELSKFKAIISHDEVNKSWSYKFEIGDNIIYKSSPLSYQSIYDQAMLVAFERSELAESMLCSAIDASKDVVNYSSGDVDAARESIKKTLGSLINSDTLVDNNVGSTIQEFELEKIYENIKLLSEDSDNMLLNNMRLAYKADPYSSVRELAVNGHVLVSLHSKDPPLERPVLKLADMKAAIESAQKGQDSSPVLVSPGSPGASGQRLRRVWNMPRTENIHAQFRRNLNTFFPLGGTQSEMRFNTGASFLSSKVTVIKRSELFKPQDAQLSQLQNEGSKQPSPLPPGFGGMVSSLAQQALPPIPPLPPDDEDEDIPPPPPPPRSPLLSGALTGHASRAQDFQVDMQLKRPTIPLPPIPETPEDES